MKTITFSKIKYSSVKRLLDVFFSILLIIVLIFPALVISILIFVDTGLNPLFSQERIGRYNTSFNVLKFRTMKLVDNKYTITKFGNWLRCLSIDEIPQIYNVLKGDMSFIGPRPIMIKDSKNYMGHVILCSKCKPGISGLAQVNGRKEIDWSQRIFLNEYYENHMSFKLDLEILFKTVSLLLKHFN